LDEIIEQGFVRLGRDNELDTYVGIQRRLKRLIGPKPSIEVAPDTDELLRYLWEDIDDLLTKYVKKKTQVVVGVSGGQTMLAFAHKLPELVDLKWRRLSAELREKLVISSLTSGGLPSDIAALSDTVAGTIGSSLGVEAQGLVGPAWFADKKTLSAFRKQQYVREHEKCVKNADIIITSVGYLGSGKTLLSHLLMERGQQKFLEEHPELSDILYHPYDGITGEDVHLPTSVSNGLFSVIDLDTLQQMVTGGKPCMVVAAGREKGEHSLLGIIRNWLKATHLYMDLEAALGFATAIDDHVPEPKESS